MGHLLGIWTTDEYLEIGRRLPNAKGLRKVQLQIRQRKIGNLRGLAIENFNNIGRGLVLPHGINIIVNDGATIGEDVVIYQGVTIGIVHSGKHAGIPIIEDRVTICPNAVIVGNCVIGHDSLIAANSFVDFDVPPYSTVIGNPGKVYSKRKGKSDGKE